MKCDKCRLPNLRPSPGKVTPLDIVETGLQTTARDETRFIILLRADGELAGSDKRGERTVTRSRRAGPRPCGIARRQEPDVRELRYVGDPLVA